MADYVFTLRNVRKAHGDKVVLDNVTLSFLHGAKIGVVGPNGTGKSTLLKIMAGLEHANNGDAILDPGATVGMLQQEPPLTEGKTVLENVEEAVAEIKAQDGAARRDLRGDGRPRRRPGHAAATETGDLPDRARRTPTPGTSTAGSTRRWTRCAARRPTRWSTTCPVASVAGSRCASCCSSSPTCCCSTSPPTTSTPSRVQWLEGHLAVLPRLPSWPSPTTGTSSTTSPSGSSSSTAARPTPTRATTRRTSRPSRSGSRSRGRKDAKRAKMLERELEWVRSNPKARQAKSKSRLSRYEEMAAEADRNRKIDTAEINIPAGPAAR